MTASSVDDLRAAHAAAGAVLARCPPGASRGVSCAPSTTRPRCGLKTGRRARVPWKGWWPASSAAASAHHEHEHDIGARPAAIGPRTIDRRAAVRGSQRGEEPGFLLRRYCRRIANAMARVTGFASWRPGRRPVEGGSDDVRRVPAALNVGTVLRAACGRRAPTARVSRLIDTNDGPSAGRSDSIAASTTCSPYRMDRPMPPCAPRRRRCCVRSRLLCLPRRARTTSTSTRCI